VLACEFQVTVDCEQLLARLDRMAKHVPRREPASDAHAFAVRRRHTLEALREPDGGYRFRESGHESEVHADPRSAAEAIFRRMLDLSLAVLPEFIKIHAGCASRDGVRLLAIGPTRAGKSTLMTRLLYEGFAVHCDDVVLLRGEEVFPYPRRFSIRPPTVGLIPQLAPFAASLDSDEGSGDIAFDPSDLGFEWSVAPGPVDAVFFLQPDTEGSTRLETCPKYAMAARVMAQSNLPIGGPGPWASDICTMLDRADCYVLYWRDLETSVAAVKDALLRCRRFDARIARR